MINLLTFEGYLGADPETKHLENEKQVTNFKLANTYKTGDINDTTWLRVTVWDGASKVAEKWLKKGSRVTVIGRLTEKSYENKSGEKVSYLEVIGRELHFPPKTETESKTPVLEDSDELPF